MTITTESVAPALPAARGGSPDVAVLLRITAMAFAHRWRMAMAFGATLAAASFQLLVPQYLGAAVDQAHSLLGDAAPEQARAALWSTAGLLLAASLARGLFTMLHNYQGEAVGQLIGYRLRMAYYDKLQQLSFAYHDRVHTGDLMTRGMLDVEGVRSFVNAGMVRVGLLVILIGVGAYLLVSTDPLMGLLSLSFVPFVAWRSAVSRLKLRDSWRRLQERMSDLSRVMDESLSGIRVVRAFDASEHEMEKFTAASDAALTIADQRVDIRVRNTTAMTFAFFAAMGLVLWAGGLKVIDGVLTIGQLTEFLAFMTILQMPVRQLGMLVNAIARASGSGARLFEVLDLEPTVSDAGDARDLDLRDGVLRFENVSFSYHGDGGPVAALHHIDFEVGPGRTLGIVGPPGSGKSTIAHLIPRFYDVGDGRITIDGQDIREVTLTSLRRAVGVVQQDGFMFTAPIANNVAYGDPWAERDRLVRATDAAQLHDYVAGLPLGYDTMVGERGASLSGGQRQRLSIARSVLTEPAIIVFDDSTAAVDAATERRIRTALTELTAKRAVIIISHRLSSLMHADEILFLEGGRIIERGSHASLLAANGKYRSLYALQVGQHGAAV